MTRLALYALAITAWPVVWMVDLIRGVRPRASFMEGLRYVRALKP